MDVNLVLLKKNSSHKLFPLPSSVTTIGRRHSCDLCIPLMSVSKKHCQLNHDEGILKIRDLDSRNGTYLNGKRVDEAVIQAGDSIKIGPLIFVLQIDGQPQTIAAPDLAAQSPPPQDAAAEDIANEQLDNPVQLEGLD
ncbi:MAG: FHA domain-containing protein [Phycisphaerae bacterium]|nr:FHA domain-containing protein [Phycisphaerae bacterium]MDD5381221.1 FHA domain-containing protein [Phycisphaerae bacterium]